jgi:hypothetical protein
MTWPLLLDFSVKLGGNALDPGQTLWGFWWLRYATSFGGSPMFSPLLWWPEGVPLWFQTWDLPSAIAVWPLWGWLPDVTLYNLPLFASFPLSGFTFFLFCRYSSGGTLGPFLAGCLYTFSTFHFAHATSTLHLASMQWTPLFFLGLSRTLREPGYAGPCLAGLALGLATLTSPYHLLFSVLGGSFVLCATLLQVKRVSWRRPTSAQCTVVVGIFVICAGWLLAGMTRSYLHEPFVGNHDPFTYSADLESFFLPNSTNVWSRYVGAWRSWGGMDWEYGNYVGYIAWFLALAAAIRNRDARVFVAMAVVGAVLALGPRLQVGGEVYGFEPLPYAWLLRAIPVLAFSGMPLRLTWLTTFGVIAAAGVSLCWMSHRGTSMKAAAVAATLLAMVEIWPRPFIMTEIPRPPIFREWAANTTRWAVIDGTLPTLALLHQMQHHHPMLAGYVTRTPQRSLAALRDDPFLSIFFRAPIGAPATPRLPIPPEQARSILEALHVRFVIIDVTRVPIAKEIGLVERYRAQSTFVYELVPSQAR